MQIHDELLLEVLDTDLDQVTGIIQLLLFEDTNMKIYGHARGDIGQRECTCI